ncbi:MAG: hypothetical protein K0M64_11225 [Rhizobium sp.]|nr:hypothetical protein [Rhizobium sp.]
MNTLLDAKYGPNESSAIDLALDDDSLGRQLARTWIEFQAERKGITKERIDQGLIDKILTASTGIDSSRPEAAALESAIRKAARGEFRRAGLMLRVYATDGANIIVRNDFGYVAIPIIEGRQKGGKRGGEATKERAQPTRDKIIKAANRLIAKGTAPRNVAGILAAQFDRTPTCIRKILRDAGIK